MFTINRSNTISVKLEDEDLFELNALFLEQIEDKFREFEEKIKALEEETK